MRKIFPNFPNKVNYGKITYKIKNGAFNFEQIIYSGYPTVLKQPDSFKVTNDKICYEFL